MSFRKERSCPVRVPGEFMDGKCVDVKVEAGKLSDDAVNEESGGHSLLALGQTIDGELIEGIISLTDDSSKSEKESCIMVAGRYRNP